MAVVLYGASLTYKSTICKTMVETPEKQFITMSNSILLDLANDIYGNEDVKQLTLAALYGRVIVYESYETDLRPGCWFDRGLLDQYIWCMIAGVLHKRSPEDILALEDRYMYKEEPTYRYLIINHDYDHIYKTLNEERLGYLGCKTVEEFLAKCDRFNNLFAGVFPHIPKIEITNFNTQLLDEMGNMSKSKIKYLLGISDEYFISK